MVITKSTSEIEKIIPNLRDLSVSCNLDNIERGCLYRSARILDYSMTSCFEMFVKILKIETIIDLRAESLNGEANGNSNEKLSRDVLMNFYRFDLLLSQITNFINSYDKNENNYKFREYMDYGNNESNGNDILWTKIWNEGKGLVSSLIKKSNKNTELTDNLSTTISTEADLKNEKNDIIRESFCMSKASDFIAKVDPNLPFDLAYDIVSSVETYKIYELLVETKERRAFVIDLFKLVKINQISLSNISSLPYFGMSYLLSFTDKIFGSNMAKTLIIKSVIGKMSLYDSYVNIFEYASRSLCYTLKIICLSKPPILFHCSLGKDRTGIIAFLVAHILGASVESIANDYFLTSKSSEKYQEFKYDYIIKELNLPEGFIDSPTEIIFQLVKFLNSKYGSVDQYLDYINFDSRWRKYMCTKFSIKDKREVETEQFN